MKQFSSILKITKHFNNINTMLNKTFRAIVMVFNAVPHFYENL